MQTYLAGQDITLEFPFDTVDGVVNAVAYRIVDDEGVEILARTPVATFVAGSPSVLISIPATLNSVPEDRNAVAREIQLDLTVAGGASATVPMDTSYRLVPRERLSVPKTSLLTRSGADLLALDMVNLPWFTAAGDDQKTSALMQARINIGSLSFHYDFSDWQSRVGGSLDLQSIDDLSDSEWASLDAGFRDALQRAQLVEADDLLNGSLERQHAASGVVSIVVGESSRTYRAGVLSRQVVCRRALDILARYLAAKRIGRA